MHPEHPGNTANNIHDDINHAKAGFEIRINAPTHPAQIEPGRALGRTIPALGAQIRHVLSRLAHTRHALLGVPDALAVAHINHMCIAAIRAAHALRRVTIRRSVAHACDILSCCAALHALNALGRVTGAFALAV
jgi:hypothetical protein